MTRGDAVLETADEAVLELRRLGTLTDTACDALAPLSRGSTPVQVVQACSAARSTLAHVALGLLMVAGRLGRLEAMGNAAVVEVVTE